MKRRNLSVLFCSVCLMLILAALPLMTACAKPAAAPAPATTPAPAPATTPAPKPVEPVTLVFGMYQAPTHEWTKIAQSLSPLVGEMTGGRVNVKIYDSGTLAKSADILGAVHKGVMDIASWVISYNSADIPFLNIGELPFVYTKYNVQHMYLFREYRERAAELITSAINKAGYGNVRATGLFYGGSHYIGTTKKQVRVPEDLMGLKIRALGDLYKLALKPTGAAPMTVATGETYEALQRGVIDGTSSATSTWIDWKWMEPCNYILGLRVISSPNDLGFLVNKASLEKLPPADRACVETFMKLLSQTIQTASFTNDLLLPELSQNELEWYYPTPEEAKKWEALGAPVLEAFVSVAGEEGREWAEIVKKYYYTE